MAGSGDQPRLEKMIAKVVPVRRRGLMFGTSNALGGLLGVVAPRRFIFERWEYPFTFGISFLLCFLVNGVLGLLRMNRGHSRSHRHRRTPGSTGVICPYLKADRNSSGFLLPYSIDAGSMGTAFYVVYAEAFGISDAF